MASEQEKLLAQQGNLLAPDNRMGDINSLYNFTLSSSEN